ncbi:odorant receptor 9a-like [Pogonomyrmex barbatus]|uniref:Odorant receptor 9a-like n=1 Tax=Pogonomyrmex barbatus TaxID=144034 RepID=A0A6I9W2H1_9HYME|nr:odorant receptor 9a-like [Pogonomyrmex barbatus]
MSDLFEEELKRNEKVRTVMLAPLRGISILAYTYSGIILIVVVTYLMPSFVIIIRGMFHLYLSTNYTLPYSRGYGYFWTVPNNFLRHFHLLFEWWAIITHGVTNASIDCAFGFYIYLLASTMRAMTFRLTNPLATEKYSDVLRICVAKHQKLIQYRDTLKRIYSVIILWHIVTNAVLLCALIYEALQLSDITIRIIFNIISYAVVKFLQTFTYAWYGTVITNADENFRNGIYFSEWPNFGLNRHMRTNILLIMMQKPMIIKVFSVSVDVLIFTNFVNTTMSYFFY